MAVRGRCTNDVEKNPKRSLAVTVIRPGTLTPHRFASTGTRTLISWPGPMVTIVRDVPWIASRSGGRSRSSMTQGAPTRDPAVTTSAISSPSTTRVGNLEADLQVGPSVQCRPDERQRDQWAGQQRQQWQPGDERNQEAGAGQGDRGEIPRTYLTVHDLPTAIWSSAVNEAGVGTLSRQARITSSSRTPRTHASVRSTTR